ncbi:MAG: pseudouridine synthase [Desulfovibrio sp.]
MGNPIKVHTVPAFQAGKRLDAILGDIVEGGVRIRRRMCESGLVLVNGRPAKPSLKMKEGLRIEIFSKDAGPADEEHVVNVQELGPSHLTVVEHGSGFIVLNKSAGEHSAELRGGGGASIEGQLPALAQELHCKELHLVNRLDYLTSGLLLVAESQERIAHWRELENKGAVCKVYAAVVEGVVSDSFTVMNKLDTANRKRTVALEDDAEALRHTFVYPVGEIDDRTLVLVRIWKGARHHIRVHLASAGYPIVGDPLYNVSNASWSPDGASEHDLPNVESDIMYLHNACMAFEDFSGFTQPPASWGEEWCEAVTEDLCKSLC